MEELRDIPALHEDFACTGLRPTIFRFALQQPYARYALLMCAFADQGSVFIWPQQPVLLSSNYIYFSQ